SGDSGSLVVRLLSQVPPWQKAKKKGNKERLGEKGRRQEGIDTELGEEPEPASSRL
ncbi:hypothetical protein CRENBAI_001784, partial [Crenichthys baileyi]